MDNVVNLQCYDLQSSLDYINFLFFFCSRMHELLTSSEKFAVHLLANNQVSVSACELEVLYLSFHSDVYSCSNQKFECRFY